MQQPLETAVATTKPNPDGSTSDEEEEDDEILAAAAAWATTAKEKEEQPNNNHCPSQPPLNTEIPEPPQKQQQPPIIYSLHVTQIDYQATEWDIRNHFVTAGCIVQDVRLVYDHSVQPKQSQQRTFRGVAFVDVADEQSYQHALQTLHKSKLLNRSINVRPVQTKQTLAAIVQRTHQKVTEIIHKNKQQAKQQQQQKKQPPSKQDTLSSQSQTKKPKLLSNTNKSEPTSHKTNETNKKKKLTKQQRNRRAAILLQKKKQQPQRTHRGTFSS
jgi:RNA recognition motif-containing protein